MQDNCVYRAIFKPKNKRKLDPEAKKLINQELLLVPLQLLSRKGYKPQWVFICNTNEFIFMQDDIKILEEICVPIEETTPDKGQE
jgi:hypothetical protein